MAALAAERLKAAILRGEYAIGQQLREHDLCQVLGVSRIPVREALHQLVGMGLVEIRPNRGAFVASPSKDELREIAEVCRILESHLLRLAVPSLKPDRLARAEAFLETLDLIDDPLEWARVNWRFHTLLYEAAERPLILEILTALRARAERAMLILVSDRERRAVLNREHRAILSCVRAKRPAKAADMLDAHLLGGRDEVLRLLGKR